MIVFDSDDFGCNRIISDMCQSHDCRDALLRFKASNPDFKATLFAIPGEMTQELLNWSEENKEWVELAVHGLYHTSNYECSEINYSNFDAEMIIFEDMIEAYFVKGFKAPGWQISDNVYQWLKNNDYWIADQPYNDYLRPIGLPVYKINNNSLHTHTWDCVGNGVYELNDQIVDRIKDEKEFKFISEVIHND